MDQEPRNPKATASLVISTIFFVQCVAFLAILLFFRSTRGIQFATANPTHPLASLGELVLELSLLAFPIDLIMGALGLFLGTQGLRSARAGQPGANPSKIGIILSLFVLLLPFVTFLCWVSAFKQ